MSSATDIFKRMEYNELVKTFYKGEKEMTEEQQLRIQSQQQTLINQNKDILEKQK